MFTQFSLLRIVLLILLLVTQLLLLPACSYFANNNEIQIQLNASHFLNPDSSGHSEPVMVSIYQLSSATEFAGLNYYQLQNTNSLNQKIIDKYEVEIRPKETIHFVHPLHPETNNIAIVAAFRDIEHAKWKKMISINKNEKIANLFIHLSTQSISIQRK